MNQSSELKIGFYVIMTIIACMANVFFLEKLTNSVPKSSNLISFLPFVVLSVDGFIFTSKFGTVKPTIPLRYYGLLVSLFFVTNLTNNLVFRFHVPMTLHMVFKSGSLMASMLLGILLLKKRHSLSKYLSVTAITIGIILCTYASAQSQISKASSSGDSDATVGAFIIGVSLMVFTLFSSAYLGIVQERLATQFGKSPRESLFYTHFLPLPFFAFMYSDLSEQVSQYNNSEMMTVPLVGELPHLWVYIIGNTACQYFCINSVFQLTAECTTLTVTLIITIRKFLSLLLSIYYFSNPFTSLHWAGTVLVFMGSAVFANLHSYIWGTTNKTKVN